MPMTNTSVPTVAERLSGEELTDIAEDCLAVHPDFGQVIQDWTNPLDYDPSAVWAEPRDAALRMLDKLVERGWQPPGQPVLPCEVFTDPQRLVDELTAIATAYGLDPRGSESDRPALIHIARMLQHVLFPLTSRGGE